MIFLLCLDSGSFCHARKTNNRNINLTEVKSTVCPRKLGKILLFHIICHQVPSFHFCFVNIKAQLHWPLWGESTGDWWIPLTKGQQRGKWRHHGCRSSWHSSGYSCPPFPNIVLNKFKRYWIQLKINFLWHDKENEVDSVQFHVFSWMCSGGHNDNMPCEILTHWPLGDAAVM